MKRFFFTSFVLVFCALSTSQAPAERNDQHQLGQLGTAAKYYGQDVLADQQRRPHQQRPAEKGQENIEKSGVGKIGLNDQHDNRPQILKDEDADRDTAGQRVELHFIEQQFDHDHRRGQRDGDRTVDKGEGTTADAAIGSTEPLGNWTTDCAGTFTTVPAASSRRVVVAGSMTFVAAVSVA